MGTVAARMRSEPRLDAQEIKTAVARQDAERADAEPRFVNRRDPALAVGPDGRPAVSRRAPLWADIPDEKWNDWRWQLSHRVNELAEAGRQVVEHGDVVAERDEAVRDVGADESRTAGHQDAHRSPPWDGTRTGRNLAATAPANVHITPLVDGSSSPLRST